MRRSKLRLEMPRGGGWTTRELADGPLAIALVVTLALTVMLTLGNTQAREDVEARVVGLAAAQNELTSLASNMTTEVDELLEEVTRLESQRAGLEKRRDAVATGGTQLELQRVLQLRERSKKELRRVHDAIDAAKKELMEFINKK